MYRQRTKKLTAKKKTIMIAAGISGTIILISFQMSRDMDDTLIRDVGFIVGVMGGIAPLMITSLNESRRRESIDKNLPIFLLAIISSVQSGTSLIRAIEEGADRNLGSLTPELKNLRANISWGMPFQEAFQNFANRVDTLMGRRVIVLLQLAVQSGGETVKTLEMMQKHMTEMQEIERERKSSLAPYLYVIYIAYVIFLAVTVLLAMNFFTQIEVVQSQLLEASQKSRVPLGMFGALLGVDVGQLNQNMFNMALIEAVFGGVAAGKIVEGRFTAGIKHVIVMIILAVIVFSVAGVGIGF